MGVVMQNCSRVAILRALGALHQRGEQGLHQELVAQAAIETLNEGILHRLSRCDVVPADPGLVDQPRIALLVSSVPLSLMIVLGRPREPIRRSSSRATRRPESKVSATAAQHSRVAFDRAFAPLIKNSRGR